MDRSTNIVEDSWVCLFIREYSLYLRTRLAAQRNDFHRLTCFFFIFLLLLLLLFFLFSRWRFRIAVDWASRQPRPRQWKSYFCKDLYLAETYSKSGLLHRVTGRNLARGTKNFCFVCIWMRSRPKHRQTSRVQKKETLPLRHIAVP